MIFYNTQTNRLVVMIHESRRIRLDGWYDIDWYKLILKREFYTLVDSGVLTYVGEL